MGELDIEMLTNQYEIAIVKVGWIKNAYQLINLGALKFSLPNKVHIFKSMGKILWV